MLDPSRVSYQWTLRQVGAFLDEANACRMTLVEVPDGFELRYNCDLRNPEPIVARFARHDLVFQDVQQEQIRVDQQGSSRPAIQPSGDLPPPQKPGGYQDFLRALGYELDQTSVYFVALDEIDQGLIVTYLFVDARHDFMPQKKMVFLKARDKQRILQDAYARRQAARAGSPDMRGTSVTFG